MSLKDQLLKAGLVSKKQAQQAESNKRKQEHDAKKNAELAQKLNQSQQIELERIAEEKRFQQERDKELNKKRDALIAQREHIYRAIQAINSKSLNTREASEPYYFAQGRCVKKVMVTPWQREMLARGKCGIAQPHPDVQEFVIIPLATAHLIRDIYAEKLIVLHPAIDDSEELDLDY